MNMIGQSAKNGLPAGQIAREDFPRFGVPLAADFKAPVSSEYRLLVSLNDATITITQANLALLERVEQVSDFHCVTTWCYRDVRWSGFRFRDVFEKLIVPQISSDIAIELLVLRGLDKYKSSLLLEDALADDVLLADSIDAQPLSSEHGAPIRIVAPSHYGYKNVKHLSKIELLQDASAYKPRNPGIMEHPRARIAYEERGRYFPGWFFRYLYRPLINMTVRQMKQ